MTLPSPAELTVIGTALCIGAGLVLFFLKSPSLALDLGIAGAVVLGAATIAYGYYEMGADSIKPQVVALQKQIADANALAVSFREQAVAAVARLEASTKAKNDAIAKLTTELQQALREHGEGPVPVVDPATNRAYVLIAQEQYERLKPLFERDLLTSQEQKQLLRDAGRRAGWDDPEMAAYDNYDDHRPHQP